MTAKKTFLNRKKIISLFFSILILSLITFSGPGQAVQVYVNLDQSDAAYDEDDENIVFTVSVDIQKDERVPLQNFTLDIMNSDGTVIRTCTFDQSGTKLTTCNHLTISAVNTGASQYGYGYMWGYGYGYDGTSYATTNTTFAYGYGYGYAAGYGYGTATGSEFKFTITWAFVSDGMPSGTYSANLEALAVKGATSYTFKQSTDTSFTITRDEGGSASGETSSGSTGGVTTTTSAVSVSPTTIPSGPGTTTTTTTTKPSIVSVVQRNWPKILLGAVLIIVIILLIFKFIL